MVSIFVDVFNDDIFNDDVINDGATVDVFDDVIDVIDRMAVVIAAAAATVAVLVVTCTSSSQRAAQRSHFSLSHMTRHTS